MDPTFPYGPSIFEQRRVRQLMRGLNAVSPQNAVPRGALPASILQHLDRYVSVGLIREASPNVYYLFDVAPPKVGKARILSAILFWFLVILIPLAVIQFWGSGGVRRSP